ncbi:unnamed protein product [Prunus armeniaca]|uniref:Uncharacterized protein n=1 Tax=Prunus armeniaca TaxID=36596 RepID=A0A6J5WTQ4_PRUAR|nr:unnamed protein product [Prunus armeniaca]
MLSTTVQEKLGTVRSFPSCYDYRAYAKAAAVISELQVDQHVRVAHSSSVPGFHVTRNHDNS